MRAIITTTTILSVIFVMSHIGGCKQKKYPSGRDTYKSFGDGKFQLLYASDDSLDLDDVGSQHTVIRHVYEYKAKGDLVFVSSEEDIFAVLNYKTGCCTTHNDINLFPEDHKNILSKIRMYKKYSSSPETRRSYGDGRFQILRKKKGITLYDIEKQEDVISNVSRWYNAGRGRAFIVSEAELSTLLNYETGAHATYPDYNSVPVEYRVYVPYKGKK